MKELARTFKALSDPTRLRILALLRQGELCVCELMAVLELPQSTVSRHLAYLRNAGLVDDRRRGVWMYYRLRSDETPFAAGLVELLETRFGQLAEVRRDRQALAELEREERACS